MIMISDFKHTLFINKQHIDLNIDHSYFLFSASCFLGGVFLAFSLTPIRMTAIIAIATPIVIAIFYLARLIHLLMKF